MGASVFPIAISTDPGFIPERKWIWRDFIKATPELDAAQRFLAGAPFHVLLSSQFFQQAVWPYFHGDQARIRIGLCEKARLSPELSETVFDLVHCNHFFLMPAAERLKKGRAPILLDTHDQQARQFSLMNAGSLRLPPQVTYEEMLAQEHSYMRRADYIIHLNAQEDMEFRRALPEKLHALIYPAVPSAPTGPGGPDIILVASNNFANVESIIWFLRDVAPLTPDVFVKIAGNVDKGVRARDPQIYQRYKSNFIGQVKDVAPVYANARLVLLPAVSGHGLSIKSVEALSSGLPLIATSIAFRGMGLKLHNVKGLTIANTKEQFAQALIDAAKSPIVPNGRDRESSAARILYETVFSTAAYERNLLSVIDSLGLPNHD